MSPSSSNGSSSERDGVPHRLVCGVCGGVLGPTHRNRARADEAADDHAEAGHPDRESVVVLALPTAVLAERRSDAIAIAEAAQRQIEER